MRKFITNLTRSLLLVPALALSFGLLAPVAANAAGTSASSGCTDVSGGITAGAACAHPATGAGPTDLFGQAGVFTTIVNILLYIIGAIAVIMLIIGGIRYVTSAGDSSAVTAAKNTILYAIIGIIVALLAYAVVNFVLVNIGTA
jgi:hypothetical protein